MRIAVVATVFSIAGCVKAVPPTERPGVVARINFYESYAPVDYRPVVAPAGYRSAEAYIRDRTLYVILIRADGTKHIDRSLIEPLRRAQLSGLLEHDYLMFGARTRDIDVFEDGAELRRVRIAGSDRLEPHSASPLATFFDEAVRAAVERDSALSA